MMRECDYVTMSALCRRSLLRLAFTRHVASSSPSRANLTQTLSSHTTLLLQTPSPQYIAKQELDVDLPPPDHVKLVITDRAAEVCPPRLLFHSSAFSPPNLCV